MPEREEQEKPDAEQQPTGGLWVTSQQAHDVTNSLNGIARDGNTLVKWGEVLSRASRKALAATSAASLAVVVTILSPVDPLQKLAIGSAAGIFAGSTAALVTPASLEERRRQRLEYLEKKILEFEGKPELQNLLIAQYKALVTADATELQRLFTPSKQPEMYRSLPPGYEHQRRIARRRDSDERLLEEGKWDEGDW